MTSAAAGSRTRRKGVRLLLAAAALAVAWVATPHAVPLYDGIGVPDEPYRYVVPPAGYQKTPAPSSVSITVPAASGLYTGQGFYAETTEIAAQYGVFINPNSLTGPASTKTFKVTVTPEAAPAGKTPEGTIDGNMYKVVLWADASPTAQLAASAKNTMTYSMRTTSASIPAVDLLFRATPSSPWTTIPSQQIGTDNYQGYFQGAGEYALTPAKAKTSSSSHTLIIVILVLVVVAMAGAVVLTRLSRRTSAGP